MEHLIDITHKGGDLFEITARQHVLHVDQPTNDGGEDSAPTPTELFGASLAACVAFYVRRFLVRHSLPTDGLGVRALFTFADRPARVGEVRLSIRVPEGLPADRQRALLAVASHCTVHNALERAAHREHRTHRRENLKRLIGYRADPSSFPGWRGQMAPIRPWKPSYLQ